MKRPGAKLGPLFGALEAASRAFGMGCYWWATAYEDVLVEHVFGLSVTAGK